LGSTALVQFLGTVVIFGFGIVVTGPSDREGTAREVSRERSLFLLPSGKLKDTAKGEHLEGTRDRNSETGIPPGSEVRELGSISGDVTREVDSGLVDQVSNNTKHADTSVLDLDGTEAVELLLVTIGNKSKRIKESKRRLHNRRRHKSVSEP